MCFRLSLALSPGILMWYGFLIYFAIDVFIFANQFKRWLHIRDITGNVSYYSDMMGAADYASALENVTNEIRQREIIPYIIMFDEGQLEVTDNFICNLKAYPGMYRRLVAISIDMSSESKLKRAHPDVLTASINNTAFLVDKHILYSSYVSYTVVLMIRSKLAQHFAKQGISFWLMQQDSLITEDFSAMELERDSQFAHLDILVDTIGHDEFRAYDRMHNWACASTMFVRGNKGTQSFFDRVIEIMHHRMFPDSTIINYLCATGDRYRCGKMPKWLAMSMNYFIGERDEVPILIQIDYSQPTELNKMQLLAANGFDFRKDEGKCNWRAIKEIRSSCRTAFPEERQLEFISRSFTERAALWIHEAIGMDPFFNRRFLHVHEGLIS